LLIEDFSPLKKIWFLKNISLNLWNSFLNINLWDRQKVSEFQKLRENKLKKLKYDLEKNSIWYIFLDNKSDILKELIKYFNKKM
jgi:hypothetical protein